MPSGVLVYWDASVCLSYINEISDRLPVLDELLNQNEREDIRLVTSTFSIVEVAFAAAEQAQHALSADTEERIDSLWRGKTGITLVEFDELTAKEARKLIRTGLKNGWRLKPADAVHLATARRHQVSECHTYDPQWARYSSEVGFPIKQPIVAQPKLL